MLVQAKDTVRALFLYLRLLVHVGQILVQKSKWGKPRLTTFHEFCRNRIYETVLNVQLQFEILLKLRSEHDDHEVLTVLDSTEKNMLFKLESSWLHRDTVSAIKLAFHEERVFLWRKRSLLHEFLENQTELFPDMTMHYILNLYGIKTSIHDVPSWVRCFLYR